TRAARPASAWAPGWDPAVVVIPLSLTRLDCSVILVHPSGPVGQALAARVNDPARRRVRRLGARIARTRPVDWRVPPAGYPAEGGEDGRGRGVAGDVSPDFSLQPHLRPDSPRIPPKGTHLRRRAASGARPGWNGRRGSHAGSRRRSRRCAACGIRTATRESLFHGSRARTAV